MVHHFLTPILRLAVLLIWVSATYYSGNLKLVGNSQSFAGGV